MNRRNRIVLIILSALLILSAVACGKIEDNSNEENNNIPKTPEEMASQIKQEYINAYKIKSVKNNDIPLKVFGIFDETWVLFVNYGTFADVMCYITVDDITFEIGSTNYPKVYNNGIFYSLNEAFDNGILTSENIRTLHENYTNKKFTIY